MLTPMRFERRKGHESVPEEGSIETFRRRVGGWMTAPEGVDYCPLCWRLEKESPLFSKNVQDASKPTAEFAHQREGTDGWSAICQNRKCRNKVFVPHS
ncbi:MAG: hypothetical protein A2945_04930 [Candidatus Liptonbacteria bacterium RIFCSPLOWO2_01_FULL_52_25]|uniref:Uncharacterized protein n=1 Tax=Candidatus Liptonbacteria bacterium RIFCSPLOWO2_01_FULL_52_25 TaxID=1798650 RepID=A0A1G2CDI3_9BACT|nr:MAG: hypothetical protein A2945_04930 [Candidatus Liptonbacteria bacterium RIFCSPLOWO2_01_FULL_52_25]